MMEEYPYGYRARVAPQWDDEMHAEEHSFLSHYSLSIGETIQLTTGAFYRIDHVIHFASTAGKIGGFRSLLLLTEVNL